MQQNKYDERKKCLLGQPQNDLKSSEFNKKLSRLWLIHYVIQ